MALVDYLDRGVVLNPDGDCFVQGEAVWSYRDVQTHTYCLGNKLRSLGFGCGDKASILSKNNAKAFVCVFGIARAGMTWVPANPQNSLDDNQHIFDFFDCQVLFFHSEFADAVRALRPRLPQLRHVVCLDRALPDAPFLDAWLAGVAATRLDLPSDPDALAMIMPTGGTTGRSKGVQLSHRNKNVLVALYLMNMTYAAGERPVYMAAAPLTHGAGPFAFAAMVRGGKVIILEKPDIGAIIDAIELHRVTELFLPPTVIYRMLDYPGVAQRDFSSMRYFIYAAAPMSVEKLKIALKVFGPCMTQVFGQTEAPALCTFLAPHEHFLDGKIAPDEILSSAGHPTALIALRILDQARQEVADGEKGEICVRGDLVTPGYYKQPELTAATIIDGWLHTGDIGYKDTSGRVHICDRSKDMIISGGFNIYPQEIEQVIWSHPGVQDCAVIGVPDEQWGEAVKAVVELNPGASVTEAEIIALCKREFGGMKAPKSVDFIASLPRSANGKVMKRELRDSYWVGRERQV